MNGMIELTGQELAHVNGGQVTPAQCAVNPGFCANQINTLEAQVQSLEFLLLILVISLGSAGASGGDD